MPAAQQNDSYTENRAQLDTARMQPVGVPNERAANAPEYETERPSAQIIPFPRAKQAPAPQERVSFMSFLPAFMTALFKDLLDFSLLTSIFGIGTILTACCYLLITLFIFFFPKRRYRTITNVSLGLQETLLIMGIGAFEGLAFPANLLPATTALVYGVYRLEKTAVEKRFANKHKNTLSQEQ